MIVSNPWLLGFCVAGLLLLLGATSGIVNARLWMSEPLVCAIGGVLLGPVAFNLIQLDPLHDPVAHVFLREAARLTLAIAVLAAAIRLPQGWLKRHWRGLAVALGPGMLLMWAAGTAIAAFTLDLPLLTCLLIGAIIAPTDPVLSAPVVGGALANRAVPADLRHAITAESGINDGLALPIVMLPIFLILSAQHGHIDHSMRDWGLEAIVIETGGAVVFGIVAGYVARLCMRWASRDPNSDRSSLLTIALALALVTLCGLEAIGGNGVLGAFVAGATLNETYEQDFAEHQEHFNEAITRFFDLPIMLLLGVAAPWAAWYDLGWRGIVFAVSLLLLRRIPAWLLLGRWMPWTRLTSQALFAGWFGPIGAAALFYALDAQDLTGMTNLWPIVTLAAAASVIAHGVSGTHATLLLGRKRDQLDAATEAADT